MTKAISYIVEGLGSDGNKMDKNTCKILFYQRPAAFNGGKIDGKNSVASSCRLGSFKMWASSSPTISLFTDFFLKNKTSNIVIHKFTSIHPEGKSGKTANSSLGKDTYQNFQIVGISFGGSEEGMRIFGGCLHYFFVVIECMASGIKTSTINYDENRRKKGTIESGISLPVMKTSL